MRTLLTAMFVSSVVFVTPAMAETAHVHGPGGHMHGPVSSEFVIQKASEKVKSLIENGKLDASWSNYQIIGTSQREMSTGKEWVVSLKNDKAKEVEKQSLHLFFTSYGSYIATNFSGK
ncbi:MAG: DUF6488 family protein [Gallionellaceae bacterium]|nr:DUF6488 family protein [Gallionellaceae bacterium]